jgi:hypothetical protein
VPSNPEALVSARAAGVISRKEFVAVKHASKAIPQAEVKDELDYALSLVVAGGLSPENKDIARKLAKTIADEIKLCLCDGCETPDCPCSGKDCKDPECKCKCHDGKSMRHTGSDIPENDTKALTNRHKEAIQSAMDSCKATMDGLDDHHQAHNKAYKAHKELLVKAHDTLSGMVEPKPADEQEPDEDDKGFDPLAVLTRARELR